MAFDGADAYGRFMGRYSEPLADEFVEAAGVRPGMRVLDVGCGPGALTARLVARLGPERVVAVDPAPPFVAAVRHRLPGVEVHAATAQSLPLADASVDAAVAQLVVHFMPDPVAGLREMARVTRPGGTVATCLWDGTPGGRGPLSVFWQAVHDVDPQTDGGADGRPGGRAGQLESLLDQAGIADIEPSVLVARVHLDGFEDWWAPFTLGVGPPGDYVAALSPEQREALRARCAELLPSGAFDVEATAWSVRGRV